MVNLSRNLVVTTTVQLFITIYNQNVTDLPRLFMLTFLVSYTYNGKIMQFNLIFITHAVGSRRGSVFTSVCLSVFFRTKSQKSTQLGSPNLTQKYSQDESSTRLFWGQKARGQGHES